MRVMVYFNLHRKCLSVKALEGARKGRVIGHVDNIILHDAVFKVSEAGRQRVLREKRKNVHAGVVGTIMSFDCESLVDNLSRIGDPVKYNPYKFSSFVHAVNETPVTKARQVAVASVNGRSAIYALFS